MNQFRRMCGPEDQSKLSVNTSDTDYSSTDSFSSSADDTADPTSHCDASFHISTDSEDDNLVCDISIQAEKPRICPAKQAHELVLGQTDASLAKKLLTTSAAPHVDTKALIRKLGEVTKTVDIDVLTILAEQMKDPILGTVSSWIRKNTPLDTKLPEIQQSKGLLRYCEEFNRLLIEQEGQLLC